MNETSLVTGRSFEQKSKYYVYKWRESYFLFSFVLVRAYFLSRYERPTIARPGSDFFLSSFVTRQIPFASFRVEKIAGKCLIKKIGNINFHALCYKSIKRAVFFEQIYFESFIESSFHRTGTFWDYKRTEISIEWFQLKKFISFSLRIRICLKARIFDHLGHTSCRSNEDDEIPPETGFSRLKVKQTALTN